MKFWVGIVIFIVGLGLGSGASIFMPHFVESYLPGALQAKGTVLEGLVARKQREADRLLLTVSTPQGALLATFKKHITEIDLLVTEGDTVSLGIRHYEPFVEDPKIKGVMKTDSQPTSPTYFPTSPREEGEPAPDSLRVPPLENEPLPQ